MAKTFQNIRNYVLALSVALMGALSLTSCDTVIYDDEGDCDIHYRLRFRFDYNLLFADAFPTQVRSVAVYAFNPDGTYAWQRSESGAALAADGYTLDLDGVDPGKYTLVGWCGMDNAHLGDRPESFRLPELVVGKTTMQELICQMEHELRQDGTIHSSQDLWALFHGMTHDVEIIDPNSLEADGQTIVYEMPLIKDTNRVRVILQQLSGADIDANAFTYTIETDNSRMAHDNALIDHKPVTYHEWNRESGVGGLIIDGSGELKPVSPNARGAVQAKVAIADLTVARLIEDRETWLTVYKPDHSVAARIPLVDYALLTKGNYDTPMTNQEFLDREDTYTLTFFLDDNYTWGGVSLYINSWRVVPSGNQM